MKQRPALVALMAISLAFALPASAQRRLSNTGSITLYVKGEFGERLKIPPQVRVVPLSSEMPMPYTPILTGDGGIVFNNLVAGEDYELTIKADGYRVATETISLPLGSSAAVTDIVYLKPLGPNNEFQVPKGQFVLAPRAEKEVQQGLNDLRSQKFGSARKHLEKALEMAPGNPYVNYVMGMIYMLSKQAVQAQPFLEKSVSIDPKQPPSLLALGTVRYDLGNFGGAIQVLEQAVQLDPTSYKSEWLLSDVYLKQRNYAKARDYAEAAIKNGKQNAAQVQLILAEALAGLGVREKAADTFASYLQQHPQDPNAAKIKGYMNTLRQPLMPDMVQVSAESAAALNAPAIEPREVPSTPIKVDTSVPALNPPPKENWAPPDIDAAKPFVISGASCSLPKVLQAAEKNAVQLVTDLQQFSATEEYQSVEIKRDEQLERPETRMFSYVVLIENIGRGFFDVQESRDALSAASDQPGPLHDVGAPARVLAFHPTFRDDFTWTCEGLGVWKDKPAWIVHFEQRTDRPTSRLAGFSTPSQLFLLPLKGRAWISENGGHVMHLETDLVHPMAQLLLMRQHFSIDYTPISFQKHNVQLWLPESVDVYYQYHGHFYHNYHHYTDFKLFWVGTSEKAGKPKETNQHP
ncbi:MAG TPA: tetratricopeptide repeat protein [Candidatus Acidoferrales bacterium]|nr:tetratricopeptide repeat protein [Candidatus Acidoferrales bacterium]